MAAGRANGGKAQHRASLLSPHRIDAVPGAAFVNAVLFWCSSVSLLDRERGFDYPDRALAGMCPKKVPRAAVQLPAARYLASLLDSKFLDTVSDWEAKAAPLSALYCVIMQLLVDV